MTDENKKIADQEAEAALVTPSQKTAEDPKHLTAEMTHADAMDEASRFLLERILIADSYITEIPLADKNKLIEKIAAKLESDFFDNWLMLRVIEIRRKSRVKV